MRGKVFLFLFLLACTREKQPVVPSGELATISYGTSFGECLGYCRRELTITGGRATFMKQSWQPDEFPTLSVDEMLKSSEWSSLVQSVDWPEFNKQPDFIGCPDCADGGAEWIQLEFSNESKKVTFEYGTYIKGHEELLEQLRMIYKRMDEMLGAN